MLIYSRMGATAAAEEAAEWVVGEEGGRAGVSALPLGERRVGNRRYQGFFLLSYFVPYRGEGKSERTSELLNFTWALGPGIGSPATLPSRPYQVTTPRFTTSRCSLARPKPQHGVWSPKQAWSMVANVNNPRTGT
jgi:hypothetical protein